MLFRRNVVINIVSIKILSVYLIYLEGYATLRHSYNDLHTYICVFNSRMVIEVHYKVTRHSNYFSNRKYKQKKMQRTLSIKKWKLRTHSSPSLDRILSYSMGFLFSLFLKNKSKSYNN